MEILDMGSGHNPHEGATLLADISINPSIHRAGQETIRDTRPFILCDIQFLPFRNQVIDIIICQRVLEHVNDPTKALNELKRIAKHGYVSYPTAFRERYLSKEWEAHQWILGNDLKKTQANRSRIRSVLSKVWRFNFNLKIRERLFKLLKNRFMYTIIRW